MGRLILVKHAMPVVEPTKSAPEWRLSEEGRISSLRLAERLAPYDPQIIISSEEPKALETARVAAAKLGLTARSMPGLHEHDRQGVPYMSSVQYNAVMQEFFANPAQLVFGRETANAADIRFRLALDKAVGQQASVNTVVVTHGTVISLFVARMTGIEPYPLWQRLGLPSFVVLTWPKVELLDVVEQVAS